MSEQPKTARGHYHVEAFCLMTYRCENCGHCETIWNSRDGVTPFGLNCPSCGKASLYHINFQGDVYAPDHTLHSGQRFFRDGTIDEAEAIILRRVDRFKDKYPIPPEQVEKMLQEIRNGTSTDFQPGWPTIDRKAPQ